jgi:4-amino-4-deoxy-L-arabinose transferase-like glycosyltransferase
MSGGAKAGAGILVASLALRVAHVLTIRDYPLFDVLPLDSESYDTWAREIAAGSFLRDRPFYQAPLYAYFLAALHAVSGGDLLLPRLVNAALGTVNVALAMAIARGAFGGRAALAAGTLCAVHGTFLFEEGKVMKTTLGLVLSSGMLWLLGEARRRERPGADAARWWFAAGLAGAAAALVRENFLLFVAAAAGWAWWRRRGKTARPAVALLAGASLGLLPCTIHNALPDGEFLPITSQAGQNFYTGVHPGNPHGGYLAPDFVRASPRFEEIDFAAEAERRAGRRLTPGRTSSFWMGEGFALLRDDPALFPRLFVRKLGLLFHDLEIPDDEDPRFFRRFAPVLRLPLPGFGVLAVLGSVGVALALRRRRAPPELLLFLATYTISVALFFVFSRYRLPLVVPLAAFSGYALVEGFDAARSRRWRALGAGVLACLPAAAVVYRPLDVAYTFANSHLSLGIALEMKGREAEAMAEYRRGLELEPENAKLLRRAARLAPAGEVHGLIDRALRASPGDVELLFRRGVLYGSEGRVAEAAADFEQVLALGEEPPGIHANLAMAYEMLGDAARARDHAARQLQLVPGDAEMRELLLRLDAPR